MEMRINVVGTSGCGKSTVAKRIAEKLNVPYIQLDELHWKPNWVESTDEELFPKTGKVIEFEDDLIEQRQHSLAKKVVIKLWNKNKPTIIFVTHDLEEAIVLAERICFFSNLPSKILLDYKINLARPRKENSKAFLSLKRLKSILINEKK